MKIPRYIVIKLEMVGKDTVKATEITDRCEVYEYEEDETEPQTEMAEDIVRSYGFKAESYRQAKAKTEQTEREGE